MLTIPSASKQLTTSITIPHHNQIVAPTSNRTNSTTPRQWSRFCPSAQRLPLCHATGFEQHWRIKLTGKWAGCITYSLSGKDHWDVSRIIYMDLTKFSNTGLLFRADLWVSYHEHTNQKKTFWGSRQVTGNGIHTHLSWLLAFALKCACWIYHHDVYFIVKLSERSIWRQSTIAQHLYLCSLVTVDPTVPRRAQAA